MGTTKCTASLLAYAMGACVVLGAGPALADPPKSDLQVTGNVAAASEYVFRGFSQTAERWAVQGGVDVTYKWFYMGVWASNLDFGKDVTDGGTLGPVARAEVDVYAGIKPVLGKITFDLGVIYYAYPRAIDGPTKLFAELDYVEFKAGASGEIWKDGTLGITVFYSPEYTNRQGRVVTVEGAFSQVLPKIHAITPTISALLGYQVGDSLRYIALTGNGDDTYLYWNAGITLGFGDRFSLDLRYWDTNISNRGGFCTGVIFQCDERFVGVAKVTF